MQNLESLMLEKFKQNSLEKPSEIIGGGIFPKTYEVKQGSPTPIGVDTVQHYIDKRSGWFDWNKSDDEVVQNSGHFRKVD